MSTIGCNSPLKEREMSSEKELIHFEDTSPSLQSKTTAIKSEFSQGDMLCAEGGSNEDKDKPCFFDFLDNILSRIKFRSEYTEREETNIGIPGPMHWSRRVSSTKSRKGDLKKHFDLDRNSLSLDDATPLLQEYNSQEIFLGQDKSYDSIQSMALMRVEQPGEDSDYSYSKTKDSHVDCSTILNWNCFEPNATEANFQYNRLDRKALDGEGLLFYESLADDEDSSFSSDCLEDFSPPPNRENWAEDLAEDSLDNIDNSSDEDDKTDDSMTSEGNYKKLVEFSDEDEEASLGESSRDGSSCSKSSIEEPSSLSECSSDGSESSSRSTDGSESLRGSSNGSERSSRSTDGSESSSGSSDGSESSSGSSGDESTSTSKSKTCKSSVSEYSTSEEELQSSCESSKGELESLISSDSETDDSTKPLNVWTEMCRSSTDESVSSNSGADSSRSGSFMSDMTKKCKHQSNSEVESLRCIKKNKSCES